MGKKSRLKQEAREEREHKERTCKKILMRNTLSPGDVLTMTVAIRDLHKTFPDEYLTGLTPDSSCDWIFENNPYLTKIEPGTEDLFLQMEYPSIHRSGWRGTHFSEGYIRFLSKKLKRKIHISSMLPDIHLSEDEKSWTNQVQEHLGYKGKFWLVNAGVKAIDYPLKQYHRYQEVINLLQGEVQFVQIGESSVDHEHTPLTGVLDMIGQTDGRQLVRLMSHAEGCLTGVSLPMHLAAAFQKPCVVIAGGREPMRWEAYPNHAFLSTNGMLSCCAYDGCWKNKPEDCEYYMHDAPRCMKLITPEQIAQAVRNYYQGGVLCH